MRRLRFTARPSFSIVLVLIVGLIIPGCGDVTPPPKTYTLTVAASPSNGGTVSKSPDQSQYAAGTAVTLTASPASGYQFDRWEGVATGSTNPTMVAMDANKTVTAIFAATLPDLLVESVTHSPEDPTIADYITFTMVVKNVGAPAGASVLRLVVDRGAVSKDINIPPIAAGGSETVPWGVEPLTAGPHTATVTADVNNAVAELDEENNARQHLCTVTAPDLVVQSVTYTPASPTTQDPIVFTVGVQNAGNAPAEASVLRLLLFGAGGLIHRTASGDVPPLAAGGSATVSLTVAALGVAASCTGTATADVNQAVAESNEANNQMQVVLTVRIPGPDLVVQSLTYAPENPTTADWITFTMVVQNAGNATAEGSVLRLDARWVAYPLFGRTENFIIPPLEAGETKEVPYIVQLPARLGTWRATATADVNQEVTEAYEDNNVMQVDFIVAAP